MIPGFERRATLEFAASAFPGILILALFLGIASPAAAVETRPGMELVGVRMDGAAATRPQGTAALPRTPGATGWDRFWNNTKDFGRGLWHGARDAIPNMWKAFKENKGTFLLAGAAILIAAATLPVWAVAGAGIALTAGVVGLGLYKAKGNPYEMGKVIGDAAFWTVAGYGLARGASALSAARTARAAQATRAAAATEAAATTNATRAASTASRATAAETALASNAPRAAGTTGRSLPVVNNPLCFVAGTPILTISGERAIESLAEGDEVLTWNPAVVRSSFRLTAALLAAMAPTALLPGAPAEAAAAVASDAAPATSAPTLLAFREDGLALGRIELGKLERGQLVRISERLWRVSILPTPADPSFKLEATDVGTSRVSTLFRREAHEVLELTARHHDGSHTRVQGTAEHPFYVPSLARWIRMGDLHPGLDVGSSSGRVARVVSVEHHAAPQPVYNFEVAGTHNYYVGDEGDAPALLAHNQCHGDRILNAGNELRQAIRSGAATETPLANMTSRVSDATERFNMLRADFRANPGTAGGHANELRGVMTGAQQTAAEMRVLAAEARAAGNPQLAASLETQIGQLDRLGNNARRVSGALERQALRNPDNPAIRAQAQSMDDALVAEMNRLPTSGPTRPRAAAASADEAANAWTGTANRGVRRTMAESAAPELRAMEAPIQNFQRQMIAQERVALVGRTADDQINFLRETRRYILKDSGLNKGQINAQLAREEAALAGLRGEPLERAMAARLAEIERLPVQTQMEYMANPFGGRYLPTNAPGNCAEWPALEGALAARRGTPPAPGTPPGQGLAMTARDPATRLYMAPCVYCQFLANNLGIRIVH